jgi:hypothetical protein
MKIWQWVTEQIGGVGSSLRSTWRIINGTFFPSQPAFDKTVVDYDLCRQLYRNDGADTHLGAGFCKPIIDNAVSFIGMPSVASDNENLEADLNSNIQTHWRPKIQEMYRNALRDSKTVVRIYVPRLDDPLATERERQACRIMLYEPERVTITYDPRNPDRISQAVIVTKVEMPDEVQPNVDPLRGSKPQVKEHEIWEVLTPESTRFYDKTDNAWLDSWARDNPWNFVPMFEVYNEYDSALSGGQSDLESVYPFIKAFHEVTLQTLKAHRYHSIPKLKFQVRDILGFLKNNFPDTISAETGQIIPGASINWQGREVLVMDQEDDLGFIEMKSVLSESKVLLEFLIDCISVASETPEWAFMRVEGGTSQGAMNAQTIPFEKKIERKRGMFQEPIQMLCKMVTAINGQTPERVELAWEEIRTESLVQMAQAIQQLVMSYDVLLQRHLISDNTAREGLKTFSIFKKMKAPASEAKDAETNFDIPDQTTTLPNEPNPKKNGTGDPSKVPVPVK